MPALQLLSAVTHDLPRVLFQVAVPPEKGEQNALPLLLRDLELKGQVVTLDALHTQRKVARAIRKKGAITSCA
jgi:predicted transposase YbfD/YdcC